jgi:hypothetical protein
LTNVGLAYFQGCAGLTHISLTGTKVTDERLALFAGRTNLGRLDLGRLPITNAGLANFKGCKGLLILNLGGTRVTDEGLVHFQGCKRLNVVNLAGTKVADLSPLKGLPLREITCDFKPERDAAILRSIKTLETINGEPAAQFLKKAGDKPAPRP